MGARGIGYRIVGDAIGIERGCIKADKALGYLHDLVGAPGSMENRHQARALLRAITRAAFPILGVIIDGLVALESGRLENLI